MKEWCTRTNRTKLSPMKKVSNMLKEKSDLILNFDTNPRLSSGVVEGFNNKAKLTIRTAYGLKTTNTDNMPYTIHSGFYHCPNLPIGLTVDLF